MNIAWSVVPAPPGHGCAASGCSSARFASEALALFGAHGDAFEIVVGEPPAKLQA
jgi:hypothetical protein